jgi:hypothetical protein
MTDELKDIAWNKDARYLHIFFDTDKEHQSLRSFFHFERESHPSRQLETLERALQSRSLSKPVDEAVCISTLSGLEIEKVLSVDEHHHRMREIWTMIGEKFSGIPSCIIFYEDQCLPFPGWRWAPRSFLYMKGSQFSFGDRKRRWTSRQSLQLGTPTPEGLRVCYPGFLITPNVPDHRDVWDGLFRPTETVVDFQDDSGIWYHMSPNGYHDAQAPDYQEWVRNYKKEFGWRMSDTIRSGKCALICERVGGDNQGQRDCFRGILAEVKTSEEKDGEKVIAVNRIMHVLISALYAADVDLQKAYRDVAQRVREDEVTAELAKIQDKASAEYKTCLGRVEAKMQEFMEEMLAEKPELKEFLPKLYGAKYNVDRLWVRAANCWENENTAVKLGEEQVWCVD